METTYHIKIAQIHNGSLVLRNYLADIFDKLEQNVDAVYDKDGFHHIVITVDNDEIQISPRPDIDKSKKYHCSVCNTDNPTGKESCEICNSPL